ncbi:M15 family metallopeptidase [Actinocorallia aurea]
MDVVRTVPILALTAVFLVGSAACGQTEEVPDRAASPSGFATPSESAETPEPTPTKVAFKADISKLTAADLEHSWREGCPVPVSGLRMITMPYWGFDGKAHEGGKLVVNAEVAQDVADTFGTLYKNKFPIRKMVPVDVYKGDDFDSIEADNTSAFNCRPATGSKNWSRHAYGMAVDINPCENPYVSTSGEVSHPRCKKFYTDRSPAPGVITAGDKTVKAFEAIGWQWGGYWSGTRDYQHFDKR